MFYKLAVKSMVYTRWQRGCGFATFANPLEANSPNSSDVTWSSDK